MPSPLPRARAVAVLAIFAFLNAGPLASQVLGRSVLPGLKGWHMYRGFGTDICVATFEQRFLDGTRRPLDRFEVLRTSRGDAPHYITFIPSEAQVARTGATMCKRLEDRPRIYANGVCGSRNWWRPMRRLSDLDLCTVTERDLEGFGPGSRP